MRILYGPSVTVMGKIIYNRKFNDNEERGVNGQVKPLVVSWLLKNMVFILVSVRNCVHIGFHIETSKQENFLPSSKSSNIRIYGWHTILTLTKHYFR